MSSYTGTELVVISCRNRHCPKCQTLAKQRRLEHQCADLLDIDYWRLVFTLPHELNAQGNPEGVYNLLFRAASQTLLAFQVMDLVGVWSPARVGSQSKGADAVPRLFCLVGRIELAFHTWKKRKRSLNIGYRVPIGMHLDKIFRFLSAHRAITLLAVESLAAFTFILGIEQQSPTLVGNNNVRPQVIRRTFAPVVSIKRPSGRKANRAVSGPVRP